MTTPVSGQSLQTAVAARWGCGDVRHAIELARGESIDGQGLLHLARYHLEHPRKRRWSEGNVELRANWPAGQRRQLELRVRARDLDVALGARVRDVTATAGYAYALGAGDGRRVMPGLVGLALRGGDAGWRAMAIVELAFGIGESPCRQRSCSCDRITCDRALHDLYAAAPHLQPT